MKISHKSDAFTLIELLVVISIIAILASIAIPVFGTAQEKAQQNKAMQQSKGIFYGLKMFAGDHNGAFPSSPDQDESSSSTGELKDANEAYANLIPGYVQSEAPFGIPSSAYCKVNGVYKGPDNDISSRNKILERGENTFAYVNGLSDTSNASYPILADGFAPGSTSDPKYSKVEGTMGGVWKGKRAIIVRCDGSASIENVNQQSLKVTRKGQGNKNLFSPDNNENDPWLVGCKVLNPRS
jgi:prepilin-type N-terminal cleavage/methylation domain-containing protein